MTAKQKAEDLYGKFRIGGWPREHSRRCIDEIVSSIQITIGHLTLNKIDEQEVQRDLEFWDDVKEELKKL